MTVRSIHPGPTRTIVSAILLLVFGHTALTQESQPLRRHRPRTLPITKFYDAPPVTDNPGQLLRSQPTDDYDLPEDVSAVRILYESRAASGHNVPASAVVLVPSGRVPAGGWPILAWAHSSSGIARNCAPSLHRNLSNGPFLTMYANLGYAVVATDYAGLGTAGRNAAMDMTSNANDIIYAVAAARAAVPQLGRKWVALGAGMGARAALAISELQSQRQDADFLGAVAVGELAQPQRAFAADPALLAYAIQSAYPQFEPSEILTPKALPAYRAVDQSCDSRSAGPQLSPADALKPGWERNKFVAQFFATNQLGTRAAHGPLFIVAPQNSDSSATTDQVVRTMCKQGDRIEFDRYSVDAAALLTSTVRDQMAWIQDRLAGRPAPSNCDSRGQ